jgi:hypothetical protein
VFVKILKKIKNQNNIKKFKEKQKKSKISKSSKIELIDIGMARNATEADFCFVPRKVFIPFLKYRNQVFFVKRLPKREIESWAQHPT